MNEGLWMHELVKIQHPVLWYQCINGIYRSPLRQMVTDQNHYNNVIMSAMVSQITNLTSVYSTVYSGEDQRKHQSSTLLVFVRGIHRWPVNSLNKGPVARKMFPFDDVIMWFACTNGDVVFASAATNDVRHTVNSLRLSDVYLRQKPNPSLIQIMACRLFGTNPLSEPMLNYC